MLSSKNNAIYGDSNAQTATVVPDLAKASDNSALSVQQNTADLEINQKLVLNDLFYETTTEEIYPQSTSAGNCAIIGSTMGFTRTDLMFLEMEFQVTPVGPNPVGTSAVGPGFPTVTNRGLFNSPAFACLQGLQRFDVSMGNNNQKIGRQQMTTTAGLTLIAQDQKYEISSLPIIAQLGLPRTRTGHNPTTLQTGISAQFYQSQTTILPLWIQHWNNALQDMILSGNLTAMQVTEPTLTANIRLGVPLGMLNSFFKNTQFLPPGTPYRFEIQFNTAAFVIAVASAAPIALPNSYLSLTHTGNFRLVYRRHELRQPAQASINNQWLTRPFLYNYETYEYYEKATDGTNINYTVDIAISQQRPTDIIIKVLYVGGSVPAEVTTGTGTGRQIAFPQSGISCVTCSNLKIYIAGRQQYYLRTTLADNAQLRREGLRDATNCLNTAVNNETYSNMDGDFEPVISSQFSSTEEFFLKVSINPGDMQKNGFMSTDMGAVVVRVEGDFSWANTTRTPLPVGYRIVYYKKLPEQITLDANKNITTITWPAVKSNSGYLIEQTFNTN
jgi:hypothetical protein